MFFLPHDIYTKHHGVRGRGFSPAVVAVASRAATGTNGSDCVDGMYRSMTGIGSFTAGGSGVATGAHEGFGYAITDAGYVRGSNTVPGAAELKTKAAANAIALLTTNNGRGCIGVLGSTTISFEAAVKAVTSASQSIVAGLVGPALDLSTLLANSTGAVAADPFVGFVMVGGALKFVYKASGEALVETEITGVDLTSELSLGITTDPGNITENVTAWVNNERKVMLSRSQVLADAFPRVAVTGIVGVKTLTAAASEIAISRVAAIAPV